MTRQGAVLVTGASSGMGKAESRLLPFLFATLPSGVADILRLRLLHIDRRFGGAALTRAGE